MTRNVAVPADRLFAVLIDPTRHVEIDGSAMIRAAATVEHLSNVSDIFTMEMHKDGFGDYQTENHVVEIEPCRKISWAPALVGQQPFGYIWTWEFTPEGESSIVNHSCDWSAVTDQGLLGLLDFPPVSVEQMATTIDRLAAAAL